jgi:hypothetical protein
MALITNPEDLELMSDIMGLSQYSFEKTLNDLLTEHAPEWYNKAKRVEIMHGTRVFLQFYRELVKSGYIDMGAPSTSYREAVTHFYEFPEELQFLLL